MSDVKLLVFGVFSTIFSTVIYISTLSDLVMAAFVYPLDVVSRGDKMNHKHVVSVGGVGMSALSQSSAVSLHSEPYTHKIHPRRVSLSIHKSEQSPGPCCSVSPSLGH